MGNHRLAALNYKRSHLDDSLKKKKFSKKKDVNSRYCTNILILEDQAMEASKAASSSSSSLETLL